MSHRQFRASLLAIIFALLAGCEVTPKQLTEEGEKFEYMATTNPTVTAWCMGRAAEERDTIWRPSVRPLDSDGTMELLVQVVSGSSTTIAVAHLKPTASGSQVILWISRQPLYRGRDEFRKALVEGCSMK